MFVPIDALKPILADLVEDRAAAPARRGRGSASSADEVQGRLVVARVSPEGPGDQAGVQRRRHHPRRRRRRRAHAGRVLPQGVGPRRRRRRHSAARAAGRSTCANVTVHSIDRVEYFRPTHDVLMPSEPSSLRAGVAAPGNAADARLRPDAPSAPRRTMRGLPIASPPRSRPCSSTPSRSSSARSCCSWSSRSIAKQILPWFGGSAAVWTTCLVFFQTTLLARLRLLRTSSCAGSRRARRSGCTWCCCCVSLAVLPIVPGAHWKPTGAENPSWLILGLLAATIGLPYFLLSTTSPLVQAWFARARPGASPYRLFALSNLASMLALLGYPFLLEPWVADARAGAAAGRWATRSSSACAPRRAGRAPAPRTPTIRRTGRRAAAATRPDAGEPPPTPARQVLWCALAATGSLLLLAVSNHITQNIAVGAAAVDRAARDLPAHVHPLLRRHGLVPARALSRDARRGARRDGVDARRSEARRTSSRCRSACSAAGLFLACMFCHGELVRLKPAPRYLTRFYLMISLGGAVGSVLVGIVAPLVLPAYFELAVGLVAVRAAAAVAGAPRRIRSSACSRVAALLATIGCGVWAIREFYDDTIVATRNFYGVLRVQEYGARRREPPPLAHPRHDHARHAVPGAGSAAQADDLLHARRRASAACSRRCIRALDAAQGRRDRPRHRHARGLRREGRRLPLLRHQSRRDRRSRSAISRYLAGQRRDDRARRSATRACRSSASRRRTSTCSRSTRSRATRFRCTSSRRRRSRSTCGT